ncbi:MAG: FGGY family carbohydrate kinase [Alphaproteobacteria bacterium]|nr:FGGY family carbohydrate kinase [Alphaproteobacteria bacterium]
MIIGIDVGTTRVKASLFSVDGEMLEHFSSTYPTVRRESGWVEQDPQDWLDLILESLRRFAATHDLAKVQSIGICSQVNTHVFVGADGKALAPAIIWQDIRAHDAAAQLNSQISDDDRIRWWGAPLPVDASHCLSRMKWMHDSHPDIWQKTRWVMLPKDYCILNLTGAITSDPIANVGLIDQNLDYATELLTLLPGAADKLAPIHGMATVAGKMKPGLPADGAPVAVGTMDAWGGMLGVGAIENGVAFYLSGTSETLGILSEDIEPTEGVIAFPQAENIQLHVAPTQSGGASILWFCKLFDMTPEEMAKAAQAVSHADNIPLFLPHLQGERAPIWDATARGMFLELDANTTSQHLARAVYEGVAFSARWVFDSLQQSANRTPLSLRCGGGGFQTDVWNQVRADILGVELQRNAIADPGVLGAAGLASVAAGLYPTLEAAFGELVEIDRTYVPSPETKPHYDAKFNRYKQAYFNNRRQDP